MPNIKPEDLKAAFPAGPDGPSANSGSPLVSELRSRFGNEPDQNETRMRANMKSTTALNPDIAAKDYDLANKYGLPIDTVRRNRDGIKSRDVFESLDYERINKESPLLAKHLGDPGRGAIFRDDVDILSRLEQQYKEQELAARPENIANIPWYSRISKDVSEAVSTGWNQNPIGQTQFKRMVYGDDSLDNEEWLNLRRSQMEHTKDYQLNMAGRAPAYIAETGAQLTRDLVEAGPATAVGAAGGGAIGAAIGKTPAAASTGARFGAKIVGGGTLLYNNFKVMTGNAFAEYELVEDDNGQKIEREVAVGAAVLTGAASSGLETIADVTLAKFLPGANIVAGKLTQDQVRDLISQKPVRDLLGKIGGAFLRGGVVEGSTEFA